MNDNNVFSNNALKWACIGAGCGSFIYGVHWGCDMAAEKLLQNKPLIADKPTYIYVKFKEKLEIVSIKDDYDEWCRLIQDDKITIQEPQLTSCRVHGRTDGKITMLVPNKNYEDASYPCVLSRNIDLTNNNVDRKRCELISNDSYCENMLGYPVETKLTIEPTKGVILYGVLDSSGIFNIQKLSNYNIKTYKKMLSRKKEVSVWKNILLISFVIGSGYFVFKNL